MSEVAEQTKEPVTNGQIYDLQCRLGNKLRKSGVQKGAVDELSENQKDDLATELVGTVKRFLAQVNSGDDGAPPSPYDGMPT